MRKWLKWVFCASVICITGLVTASDTQQKTKLKAAYVPLSLHSHGVDQANKRLTLPNDTVFQINRMVARSEWTDSGAAGEL